MGLQAEVTQAIDFMDGLSKSPVEKMRKHYMCYLIGNTCSNDYSIQFGMNCHAPVLRKETENQPSSLNNAVGLNID